MTEHRAPDRRNRIQALEVSALVAVQQATDVRGTLLAAQTLSRVGEHAAGWLLIGALGTTLDRPRRREWADATAGVLGAHAASVVLKRVARRLRPLDGRVHVRTGTPSRWSFPSSHASSTTAAALGFGAVLGRRGPWALVPAMAVSRLVLGVHYPSDVLAGIALGAGAARLARRHAVGRRG